MQEVNKIMKEFPCERCGACCRNLDKNDVYNDLNRGDGICKYFDEVTRLCSLYATRPDKCNVKKGYQYFKEVVTFTEYIKCNLKSCEELKRGSNSCQYHFY